MVIRLASLALIMVIGGSVFAGMPLRSNEQECSIPGMAGMDCCKKAAQAESLAPEVATARLCCALICSQSGTTGSTESRLPRQSTSQAVAIHLSCAPPLIGLPQISRSLSWAHSPPPFSNPAYIRHLAL